MYELKTKKSNESVIDYLQGIEDSKRKSDALKLYEMIKELHPDEPKLWGGSIIGYGDLKYKNSTNKEYDWFRFGFSPRKNYLSLYVTAYSEYLTNLAKDNGLKHGKGCIYIKDIDKVDKSVILEMIRFSMEDTNG